MLMTADARVNSRRSDDRASARYDLAIAALASIVAGGVYLATMFPGLAAIGDTPKFQFVGAVLGTPHPPGYPVYMLLLWAFAQLPFGTLAYRANLLSVVFGAISIRDFFISSRASSAAGD